MQKIVLGRQVRLQKDYTAADANNRSLRYVFVYSDHPKENGIFVNEVLLAGGFARFQTQPRDKLFQEVLSHTAGVAKNESKGLHKQCPEESKLVEQQNSKCFIKGNYSPRFGKSYFIPGCPNYDNVKIEKADGDTWFCTEAEAKKAGYQKAELCP